MRYDSKHAEATRVRIQEACARQFRLHGFGDVGVDGLSRAADVTTGAFYNHFGSKAAAFAMVVRTGVERLREGIERFRHGHGERWLPAFADYYLGAGHRGDVAGGCALPSLSADVAHADAATRAAYQEELVKTAELIAAGLSSGGAHREAAWPILAQLAGGVLLARAVSDPDLADEIARAVRGAVNGKAS